MKKLISLILVLVLIAAAVSSTAVAVPQTEAERELAGIADNVLNIVIDGGTELNNAAAGSTVDVKIRLVNNVAISSLKITLYLDEKLSVYLDARGKPKVTFDIYDPEDPSVQKSTLYNEEANKLILNWVSAEDEVRGDTVYATVKLIVAEDADPGSFLPITASINPNDVFDIDQNNIEFNRINGGIDIMDHIPGDIEYDAENHWHKCTTCGEILDIEPHTFKRELTAKETCTTYGEVTKVCTVCGYTEYEKIAPIGHITGNADISEPIEGMLNIIIDGGTSVVKANPGDVIDVKICLVNNVSISSLKLKINYAEELSVVMNSKGKPDVKFDIYDPDSTGMKNTTLKEEERALYINWVLPDDEFTGDTVFATIKFKVSEDAVVGKFLPVTAEYNPKDVFDTDYVDIPVNLINGGVFVKIAPDEYGFNETEHWHICFLCGDVVDAEAHVDEDNDCVCDVCGYAMIVPGDTDGDGEINNKDVVVLFRYVSSETGSIIFAIFDFNGDGEINNKDVVELFRFVSGK